MNETTVKQLIFHAISSFKWLSRASGIESDTLPKFIENGFNQPQMGVHLGSIRAKSASVVTKWSHTFQDMNWLYLGHQEGSLGHSSWLENCCRFINQGGPISDLSKETSRVCSAFVQWSHWRLTSTGRRTTSIELLSTNTLRRQVEHHILLEQTLLQSVIR